MLWAAFAGKEISGEGDLSLMPSSAVLMAHS